MNGAEQEYRALLAEEIFIVQVHGLDEEASRLEEILDECASSAVPASGVDGLGLEKKQFVEILALAESIRFRQKLGMHFSCCPRCEVYAQCGERLARAKHSVRCNCCRECGRYAECSRQCLQ